MPESISFNHLSVPSDLSSKSASAPLPSSVRHQLESDLGKDFSNVRVYQSHAATLVNAVSFTRGNDIFFAPGKYEPLTPAGRELLAHELTHVVQQSAPTPGSQTVPSQLDAITME